MTGSITASCGHKVDNVDDMKPVRFWDQDDGWDGIHDVLVYATYCTKCEKELRESGLFVSDEEEKSLFT